MPQESQQIIIGDTVFKLKQPFAGFEDLRLQGRPATLEEQMAATRDQIKTIIRNFQEEGIAETEIVRRLRGMEKLQEVP